MTSRPIRLETGEISLEQLLLVLETLPIDLTFVDENGMVRFYSRNHRIFERSPEVIGTDVQECHSPPTRPGVAQLMSELATGWRDSADFVEEHEGRMVSVRYQAVRDDTGAYRGVLEIAQYVDEFGEDTGEG